MVAEFQASKYQGQHTYSSKKHKNIVIICLITHEKPPFERSLFFVIPWD